MKQARKSKAQLLSEREKLIAMLKEMREASAALMRTICSVSDNGETETVMNEQLQKAGVRPGFGVRCQNLIDEAEGKKPE